jgi:hypothetical protein
MGEAINKPEAFELTVTTEDKHLLFTALSTPLRCPACKSGPIDTSDPVKFMRFAKVWNLFNLSEFDDIPNEALIQKLTDNKAQTLTVDSDAIRYTIETVLTQSNTLNVFTPAVPFLNKLITIATENKIKLKNYDEFNSEIDNKKQLTLSAAELNALVSVLVTSQKCSNTFALNNGSTISHGAPIDHPTTIKEYKIFSRVIEQLQLIGVITGKNDVSTTPINTYELDIETVKYLLDLIPKRSTYLQMHPSKLVSLVSKLEELKK